MKRNTVLAVIDKKNSEYLDQTKQNINKGRRAETAAAAATRVDGKTIQSAADESRGKLLRSLFGQRDRRSAENPGGQ